MHYSKQIFFTHLVPLIRQHLAGIIVAVVVSFIISLPPVIFHFSPAYRGVDMLKTNTEQHYVAQIQEVYDGHASLGNPYLADMKDAPYLFPLLGPNIIAGIGKLLGISAIPAVLVTRFLFSFGTAFFLYLFALQLGGRRLIAMLVPAGVMLAYNLLDPQSWKAFLEGYSHWPNIGFLGYGRPINSQVSSFFYVAYLYFFWRYLEGDGRRWQGIVSAVLLGLSFYVYLFTWTFLFSLNFFLIVLYGLTKEWKKAKRLCIISIGAAVIGVPYLWHIHEIMQSPWYAESAVRFGFVTSYANNVSRVVVGTSILFLVSYRLFTKQARLFWAAFFLTAMFVTNEQVLTGKYIFNIHYHWYYNTPLAITFLLMWFGALLYRWSLPRTVIWVVVGGLLLVLCTNGILRQHRAYITALPSTIEEQRYLPLFRWLNTETPKDSTVLSNVTLSAMIPAFTHNNVYDNTLMAVTLLSNDRLFDSYTMRTYLQGIPAAQSKMYFEEHRNEISDRVFNYQYRFQPGVCLGCFPNTVIDTLVAKYQSLTDTNFFTFLHKYPLDYIVVDRRTDAGWKMERFGLPIVATFDDLVVYGARVTSSSRQ